MHEFQLSYPMARWRSVRRLISLLRRGGLAACLAGVVAHAPARAAEQPPAIEELKKLGVTVIGKFPAKGGLEAWAAYQGEEPVALYVTPDGKHVIAGMMLDAAGDDVNRDALEEAVYQEMTQDVWGRLERSAWIADGQADAARTVYVFTDMNCPYCNKLWMDARPWVESGKVQLRHVLVGVIKPNSGAKAAAVLAGDNPSGMLAQHARLHTQDNMKALRSGRARPLDDRGVQPLASIPPAIQQQLDGNHDIMASLGLHATPAMVWVGEDGAIKTQMGASDSMLPEVFGPR